MWGDTNVGDEIWSLELRVTSIESRFTSYEEGTSLSDENEGRYECKARDEEDVYRRSK